jgi:hypothetical protein
MDAVLSTEARSEKWAVAGADLSRGPATYLRASVALQKCWKQMVRISGSRPTLSCPTAASLIHAPGIPWSESS